MRQRQWRSAIARGLLGSIGILSTAEAQDDRWDQRWEGAWDKGFFQAAPPCSLDLRAAHRTRPENDEWFFGATFRMPLSGCRSSSLSAPPGSSPNPGVSLTTEEGGDEEGSVPIGNLQPLPEARGRGGGTPIDFGALPAGSTAPNEPDTTDALTPSFIEQVVGHALAASGLDVVQGQLIDQASRARLSGLLPELRLRGALGLDQSTSLAGAGLYPGDTTLRGGSDSVGEVRLTFRLNRLLFDDTEPALERLRLQLLAARQKVTETAVELLLEWFKWQRRSRDLTLTEEERIEAQLSAEGASVRLHVLTGGWFLDRRATGRAQTPPSG